MCAQESQKRTSDLLKLEIQTVVSHHVGAGTQPRSSARAASDPNLQNQGEAESRKMCTLRNAKWSRIGSVLQAPTPPTKTF